MLFYAFQKCVKGIQTWHSVTRPFLFFFSYFYHNRFRKTMEWCCFTKSCGTITSCRKLENRQDMHLIFLEIQIHSLENIFLPGFVGKCSIWSFLEHMTKNIFLCLRAIFCRKQILFLKPQISELSGQNKNQNLYLGILVQFK